MHQRPPKQHFITLSFMKQWADDTGKVGVVCLHHRGSGLVSPKGLHHVLDLASDEQEKQWSRDENRAKKVLDEFKAKLGSNSDQLEAAETYLSGLDYLETADDPETPSHLETLIELVALHHARSLVVPLQQGMDPNAAGGTIESEAAIRERWDAVRDHYGHCGIGITVYEEDTPVVLGAIPVFDAHDWGNRTPNTARFLMPLTPRAIIGGTPDWPPGQVGVVRDNADHETLLTFQIGGVPGLFSTPYLVCEPSALERTAETALRLFEGSNWHWHALKDRIDLCGGSAPGTPRVDWRLRADWQQRTKLHARNQGLLGITTSPVRQRLHDSMAEDARKIQQDLDDLGVPMCACHEHRSNPDVSALWKATMPQAVCQEMRQQRNAQRSRPEGTA